jgi:hypothetical protein
MIQAMICSSVLDVWAEGHLFQPQHFQQRGRVARGSVLSSRLDILSRSQSRPGRRRTGCVYTAHFHASSSSRGRESRPELLGAVRTPPLAGPAVYGVLHPESSEGFQAAIVQLHRDVHDDLAAGFTRRIFQRPSSSFSLCAARSERATQASHGFTSSRYAVGINLYSQNQSLGGNHPI